MSETFYVEIVRDRDGHVARRMGPMTEQKAESVRSGASINLDHDNWSVRIVEEEK